MLANLYRCVRDKHEELIESLKYALNSREDFEIIRDTLAKDSPMSDTQRAAYFYQLIRYSYASGLTSFASQPHDMRANFPMIEQAHRRLAKVVIENKDFEKLIRQYDRQMSFFYCDPPYYETEGYYHNVGEAGFTAKDHIRLRDMLTGIEGKFLLSYNDHPFVRELYSSPDIHLMEVIINKSGGCVPVSELDNHDAAQIAMELIQNEAGTVTPYGVVYCNDMKLEQLYTGWSFPAYFYDQCLIAVEAMSKSTPEAGSIWLYLPMPDVCVERALMRGEINGQNDIRNLDYTVLDTPINIFRWTDAVNETPETLNQAAQAIRQLSDADMETFYAAVEYIEPGCASDICYLAERLDLFDFYPGVLTAEEYGRHMITESGHFEYDKDLNGFYDFEGYGKQRLEAEHGEFISSGYICYNGEDPLETVFEEQGGLHKQGAGMTMGGM